LVNAVGRVRCNEKLVKSIGGLQVCVCVQERERERQTERDRENAAMYENNNPVMLDRRQKTYVLAALLVSPQS
jgi:hypothetical protein